MKNKKPATGNYNQPGTNLLLAVTEYMNSDEYQQLEELMVFAQQTALGKSWLQDAHLREICDDVDRPILIRLSPTNDVRDDGTFNTEYGDWYNGSHNPNSKTDTYEADKNMLSAFEREIARVANPHKDYKVTFNWTTQFLITNFDSILAKIEEENIGDKIHLIIEEAHHHNGCSTPGRIDPMVYKDTIGYLNRLFDATGMTRIKMLMEHGARGIAFSATPTKQQLGALEVGLEKHNSDGYGITNVYATYDELLAHKAYLDLVSSFEMVNESDVDGACEENMEIMINRLHETEDALTPRVRANPLFVDKLTALILGGNKKPSKNKYSKNSVPTLELVDTLQALLVKTERYDLNEYVVAIMASTGCYVYNLRGGWKKMTQSQIFKKLNNPNDPLRFLVANQMARMGINVHNLSEIFISKIPQPQTVVLNNLIQALTRPSRAYVAFMPSGEDVLRTKYQNSIPMFLENAPTDYNVPVNDLIEVAKLSNRFNVTYCKNNETRQNQTIWEEAIAIVGSEQTPRLEDGIVYLDSFAEKVHVCPMCQSALPHTHPVVNSGKSKLILP